MEEQGSFVAPPPTGAAQGETTRVGFDTGTIVLPEVRVRLPRFELPTVFRMREAARMITEGGVAPWMSQGQANAFAPQNEVILRQQVASLQAALAQSAPAGAQTQAEAQAATQAAQAAQAELDRVRCELNRLRQLEAAISQAQQNMRDNPNCQGSQAASVPTPAARCPEPLPPAPTPTPADGARRSPQYPSRPIQQTEPIYQPVSAPFQERATTYEGTRSAAPPRATPVVESQEVRPIVYASPVSHDNVIRQPALLPTAGSPIRQPAARPQGRIVGVTPRG